MKTTLATLAICALACSVATDSFGQGRAYNLPSAQRLMEPGPGVGGPGPGVLHPLATGTAGGGGVPAAALGGMGAGPANCGPMTGMTTSQIAFLGVSGGEVSWDISGQGLFDSSPMVMPGRQNFRQGAIYRLKLTNLPDREGVELYPTLEVAPVTPRTDAFLAHAPIPVQFTDEDLDQVLSGNFVTKVIYLPDPEFQELALAGVETLVSTRLDPGVDPIAEADRRGSIMAILRVGNLDLQLPGQGMSIEGVVPAQYTDGNPGAPQGMPTAGFSPRAVPPHMVSGMNMPQWGMPITGTPIGLPGPPHVPLGHRAGLVKHEMRNRTRVMMPPPVHNMKINVKQRPGMNYPRPVNHVNIAETNRAGFRMFGGTTPPAAPTALQRMAARLKGDKCVDGSCP